MAEVDIPAEATEAAASIPATILLGMVIVSLGVGSCGLVFGRTQRR